MTGADVSITETLHFAATPRMRMARPRSAQARTEILHVRLSTQERERLKQASEQEYIDQSTWARRAILQALDAWDESQGTTRRGARATERPPARPPRK